METMLVVDLKLQLPAELRGALEKVLEDHRKITDETLTVVISGDCGKLALDICAARTLQSLKLGRKKEQAALLLIDPIKKKASLKYGFGLEGTLSAEEVRDIIEEAADFELAANRLDRATTRATLETLRALESPLIMDGKAGLILKSAGSEDSLIPSQARETSFISGSAILLLGGTLLALVLYAALAAEAHYTARGWFRPSLLRLAIMRLKNSSRRGGAFTEPKLGGIDGHW